MLLLFFFLVLLVIFIQKKNNRDYFITLPYYLLLLDFAKVIPIWGEINGYNGYELFVLLYFVSGYLFNTKWLSKDVKSIIVLTISLCVYLFFRMSFEEDTVNAISRYGAIVYVLLLVPLAIRYINHERFIKLINVLYKYLILYVIITIILSIFKIGPNMYNTGLIYGLEHDQLNAPAFALIIVWFFKKHLKKTNHLTILTITLLIIFLLTFKRTPVIMIGIGLSYLVFNIKGLLPKISLIVLVGCAISVTVLFVDIEQIQKREKYSTTIDTEKEGRFIELENVNEIIKKDMDLFFWGNGKLFFTRGGYDLDTNQDRPIHSFYGELLLGAGYIGLIIFLILIASIIMISIKLNHKKIKYFNNYSVMSKQSYNNEYLYFLFCSITILLVTLFVGSIRYIGYNGLLFFIIGSALGQLSYINYGIPFSYNNKK